MKMQKIVLLGCILISGCNSFAQPSAPNTLTDKEKKADWKLLFDGKTLSGWHSFKSDKIGPAWKIGE